MNEQPTQRVLGAVRQSKTRDRSVSKEAQTRVMLEWIKANRATKTAITLDLSTSGSVSVFRRKGVGPYLTDPDKIDSWDTLVVTRLDRACRDLADYITLAAWCDRHGKRMVVLDDPSLDTSTPQGRAMAAMRATFAQLERELARARNKERYSEMIEQGKWTGGRVNYGWRYDREQSKLVPDEGRTADVLRTMAEMAIAGKSQGQIAQWLNDSGHVTVIGSKPNGTKSGQQWKQDTVRRVLRHEATADLLGEAKAAELRAALRSREQTRGERVGGHLLLRVAYCRQCGGPLYCAVKRDRPSGGYYRCLKCKTHMRMDRLEQRAEDSLLFLYGHLELVEYELKPGDDHQTAIHALERDINALEKISGTEAVITLKRAEIEHLQTAPFTPDHYVPVPQGITVAQHWETLDDEGKGSFLRRRRVRVLADREGFEFHGGLLAESETAAGTLEYVVPGEIR